MAQLSFSVWVHIYSKQLEFAGCSLDKKKFCVDDLYTMKISVRRFFLKFCMQKLAALKKNLNDNSDHITDDVPGLSH